MEGAVHAPRAADVFRRFSCRFFPAAEAVIVDERALEALPLARAALEEALLRAEDQSADAPTPVAAVAGLLREHMVNPQEAHVRGAATALLASLLTLPAGDGDEDPSLFTLPLNAAKGDAELLSEIFGARIQDYYATEEALCILWAMTSRFGLVQERGNAPSWLQDWLTAALRGVFAELTVPALPQRQRHIVFRVLEIILERMRSIANVMQGEFVVGYLQAVDGEKDPRCLALALRGSADLLTVTGHERFVEDIFELIACYFPVTFRGGDPEERKRIAAAVRDGLAATPRFAPFALSFFLEKLESSAPGLVGEVLDTLAFCAEAYGAEAMQGSAADVVLALVQEALGENSEFADRADQTEELEEGEEHAHGQRTLRTAACECMTRLVRLQALANDGGKGLTAWIRATATQCRSVFQKLSSEDADVVESSIDLAEWVPALMGAVSESASDARDLMFSEVKDLIASSLEPENNPEVVALGLQSVQAIIQARADSLPGIESFISILTMPNTNRAMDQAFSGALVSVISSINEQAISGSEAVREAVEGLLSKARAEVADSSLASSSIVAALAHAAGDAASRNASGFFALMERFFVLPIVDDAGSNIADAKLRREVGVLCRASEVWAAATFQRLGPAVVREMREDGGVAHLALLVTATEMFVGSEASLRRMGDEMFAVSSSHAAEIFEALKDSKSDPGMAGLLDRYFSALMTSSPSTVALQRLIFQQLLPVGLPELEALSSKPGDQSPSSLLRVRIFSTCLAAGGVIPSDELSSEEKLLRLLFSCALASGEEPLLLSEIWDRGSPAVHCCAVAFSAMLNRAQDAVVAAVLEDIHEDLLHAVDDRREGLAVWTVRALYVRAHLACPELISDIINRVLKSKADDVAVADLSCTLMEAMVRRSADFGADGIPLLTAASHARLGPLYQQRLLCNLLPPLTAQAQFVSGGSFVAPFTVVVCIAVIVTSSPPSALTGEIERIFPLLCDALESSHAVSSAENRSEIRRSQTAVLRAMALLLAIAPPKVLEAIEPMATRIVRAISSAGPFDSTAARQAMVRLFLLVSRFSFHAIFPVKHAVLSGLQDALDDDSRAVRREASKARNAWLMMS